MSRCLKSAVLNNIVKWIYKKNIDIEEIFELNHTDQSFVRNLHLNDHLCGEWRVAPSCSCSKSELSGSEVVLSLLLSECFSSAFELGQSLSESSCSLVSQVKRSSGLLGVISGLVSPLLIDHSEHLGDGLSDQLWKKLKRQGWNHYSYAGQLHLWGGGDLAYSQLSQFFLLQRTLK